MRKLFAAMLALALLCGAAMGEGIDWAGMTDDELHTAIDAARNELVKRDLVIGENVVLLNQNNVQVYLTGEYKIWGSDNAYLNIEAVVVNDSNTEISVNVNSSSINGWDVFTTGISSVTSGKKKKGSFQLLISDADISSFEEIEDWEVSFTLYDSTAWKTICTTEPITIQFNAE